MVHRCIEQTSRTLDMNKALHVLMRLLVRSMQIQKSKVNNLSRNENPLFMTISRLGQVRSVDWLHLKNHITRRGRQGGVERLPRSSRQSSDCRSKRKKLGLARAGIKRLVSERGGDLTSSRRGSRDYVHI